MQKTGNFLFWQSLYLNIYNEKQVAHSRDRSYPERVASDLTNTEMKFPWRKEKSINAVFKKKRKSQQCLSNWVMKKMPKCKNQRKMQQRINFLLLVNYYFKKTTNAPVVTVTWEVFLYLTTVLTSISWFSKKFTKIIV